LTGGRQDIKRIPFTVRLQATADKCTEVKLKMQAQPITQINASQSLTCGVDYVRRGGTCITPTAACQLYFGQNVTGKKSTGSGKFETAECTCNTGYSMTNSVCVAKSTNLASVAVGSPSTDAQLRELIAQLTAQVMSLMKQLSAKNY
jgi:hypothetical protein